MNSKNYLFVVLKCIPIVIVCVISDYILKYDVFQNWKKKRFLKAVSDNIGHGTIASLTWLVVVDYQSNVKNIIQVIVCGLVGCAIDLDHFLHARSFKLKNALHLSSRPPFHNTTIIFFLIPLFMLPYLYEKLNPWLYELLLIVLTAILSHHLRDGNRRGLWFKPFGSTRPLTPSVVYISGICILPALIWMLRYFLLKYFSIAKTESLTYDV